VRLHRARARLARHPRLQALLRDDGEETRPPDRAGSTVVPAC
jgi:hypothetical protein